MSGKELIHGSFGASKMAGNVENAIEVKKTQTNATSVTLHPLRQAI